MGRTAKYEVGGAHQHKKRQLGSYSGFRVQHTIKAPKGWEAPINRKRPLRKKGKTSGGERGQNGVEPNICATTGIKGD